MTDLDAELAATDAGSPPVGAETVGVARGGRPLESGGRARARHPEEAAFRTYFVAPEARAGAAARLEAVGLLVATIVPVGASARGRLADVVDEAIERELGARGAAPPGIGSSSDADAALGDQLFRARRVGARGIGVVLGTLRAAASPRGALEAEDSATLRFWAHAARERPVALILDAGDEAIGAYGDPAPLATLLGTARGRDQAGRAEGINAAADARAARETWSENDREGALTDAADDASENPTPTPTVPQVMPRILPDAPPAVATLAAGAGAARTDADDDEAHTEGERPTAQRATVVVAVVTAERGDAPGRIAAEAMAEPAADGARPSGPRARAVDRQMIGASVAVPGDEWRGWTLALTAARGPQPLAAFEKLFAHDYMPLANAIASGLDDPRALHAHAEFRRTFARAYSEACPTFAVTGKRPRMVLDAPDVAARIARLHGARSTQILLVDAMRFDLGTEVKVALQRALGTRGALTDETLLWSALPTTSSRQIEALSRGIDALRVAPDGADREADPLRGRTAEMIRRIKIGSRDVYKLDLVEARLRESTTHALDMIPALAESVADVVARHALTLQPRTLLFVFGDHGFTLDKDGEPHQGGASPEEVLVPGFAFLVGDVH